MKTIMIKNYFDEDLISRIAGEKLRLMIFDLVEENKKICLDFKDTIIASTSFFDEGIAKFFLENKNSQVQLFIKNLNKNDQKVLEKVSKTRGVSDCLKFLQEN